MIYGRNIDHMKDIEIVLKRMARHMAELEERIEMLEGTEGDFRQESKNNTDEFYSMLGSAYSKLKSTLQSTRTLCHFEKSMKAVMSTKLDSSFVVMATPVLKSILEEKSTLKQFNNIEAFNTMAEDIL